MRITITPYAEAHIQSVIEFNRRLQAGGAPPEFVFPRHPVPVWLPKDGGGDVYNEFYVALDGDTVRGAFAIKRQPFLVNGELRQIAYYHHPFSEGIVDRAYAQVGLYMLKYVIRQEPLLYTLGMGGYDRPLPRMLMALGWSHCLVPFFFRVRKVRRFLSNMRVFRTTPMRRIGAALASATGAGWLGIHGAQMAAGFPKPRYRGLEHEVVPEFGGWAEDLWNRIGSGYQLIGARNLETLRVLYAAGNTRLTRLKVMMGGKIIGWAAVAETLRPEHAQYGNMNVGWILDAFAAPENASAVTAAAARALDDLGVDLILSNQSHSAWSAALRVNGFLSGPSNFIFAPSPKLAALLPPIKEQGAPSCHLNRADGDGLYQYV